MSSELTIAVSGKSGCGNTTVSKLLAERLGLRLINYTFHDMARERGVSFEELCRLAEQDNQYDLYLDRRQVELASSGGCVLGSRLAIWLLPQAHIRVYLTASPEERARRIALREGLDPARSQEDVEARDTRDRNRYLRLYRIDIDDHSPADLVVDTEAGGPPYVVETVLAAVRARQDGPPAGPARRGA
jgi:cytidylate kinase